MTEYNPRTIFDKGEEGDSQIYVGIKFLQIVAAQIDLIRQASRNAYIHKGDFLFIWIHELRTFYDLIENRTNLFSSDKKIKLFEWKLIENKLEKVEIEIEENKKYEKWFEEIEKMIERNSSIRAINTGNIYASFKHINDKKILSELSNCMRNLMRDANTRHLIMPEGMKDMKSMIRNKWVDREKKKDFTPIPEDIENE